MKIIITEGQYKQILFEDRIGRSVVRQVVRDLTNMIKRNEEGNFYLPHDVLPKDKQVDFYEFDDFEVPFSVEFKVIYDESINRFLINGSYSIEDDTIEIILKVNPNNLKKEMYDIIGELNILVAHELEHGLQGYYDEFDLNKKEPKNPLKYYLQSHEIPAQIQGFKRLAKLQKVPLENVVRNWFDNNKTFHQLKPKQLEKVIQSILKLYGNDYGK
jgi:hypothetical protein